jgi:hypothetical protein
MTKKNLFFAFLTAILVIPFLAHGQTKHRPDKDDDDDDDRPVFRPPALRPGEKPLDADFTCPYVKGFEHPERFNGYTLRLNRGTKTPTDRCRAVVTSTAGKRLIAARDWALKVDKISGTDINGDDKPELVIDGYSGGERCCFTYTVVKLGASAQVLRSIASNSALNFEKQDDGSVLIKGVDSSMDYFVVPHPMAVVPQVFLKMKGDTLEDVSAQFQPQYDKLIDDAKSQLTPADLEKFRQSRYNDKMFTDQLPTARRVLTIIVNYLYSGREDQAWKTLDDLWPISDQGRLKNLILERRARGLLKQLNAPNAGAVARTR